MLESPATARGETVCMTASQFAWWAHVGPQLWGQAEACCSCSCGRLCSTAHASQHRSIISDAILYLWAMAFLCHKLGRHSFTWRGSPYNL